MYLFQSFNVKKEKVEGISVLCLSLRFVRFCIHSNAALKRWCAWLLLASSQLHCNLDVSSNFTAALSVTQSQSLLKPWTQEQPTDRRFRWRLCLGRRMQGWFVHCFSWGCSGNGGWKGASQVAYYLMWCSEAGRLFFFASFVFSVKVHLINMVQCQGPAETGQLTWRWLAVVCIWLGAKSEASLCSNLKVWRSTEAWLNVTFFFCSQDLGMKLPLN